MSPLALLIPKLRDPHAPGLVEFKIYLMLEYDVINFSISFLLL